MVSYTSVISSIDAPNGREKVIKEYQLTKDIIKDLVYCFKHFHYQAAPVAELFSSGSAKEDAKRIYDFIKNNIEYQAEEEEDQTTRSFSRIIHDKWGDCKHSALLASSLAWQLGYNVILRFVRYNQYNKLGQPEKGYGHVYTLLQDPVTKEKFIIDPLQSFNYEKPYLAVKNYLAINNKNPKKMLSRLTGTDVQSQERNELSVIGNTYDDGSLTVRLINPEELEAVGKLKLNIGKAIKKVVEKVKERGGVVRTIALAPVRAAAQVLLLTNFRNFSGRLAKMPAGRLDEFAKKFGFSASNLKSYVAQGSKQKPFLGGKVSGELIKVEGVGITLEAAILGAAPVIIYLTKLFKDNNMPEPTDEILSKNAVVDLTKLPDSGSAPSSQVPDEAKSFFEKYPIATPLLWIGGGFALLKVGGKILNLK